MFSEAGVAIEGSKFYAVNARVGCLLLREEQKCPPKCRRVSF
jgi:hypothetical protein